MIYHLIALLTYTLFIHSTNIHTFQVQHTPNNSENLLKSLQQELRDPAYRTEILPNNFSHLSQLIASGDTTGHSPTYLRSVVKLFSNMLKSAHYVNAYEFELFMSRFGALTEPYFSLSASRAYITQQSLYDAHMFDRFQATVHNVLYMKFSTEYDSFRRDPNEFLNYVSSEIVAIAQEEIEREQLRRSIIRFIEIALSKLIWNVSEANKSWTSAKNISLHLANLVERNILDDLNDLDDVYWSLLTRYCYFVELTALDVTPSFYTTIKNDIARGDILLLSLEEQDVLVETKLSYLQRTLITAEAQLQFKNR